MTPGGGFRGRGGAFSLLLHKVQTVQPVVHHGSGSAGGGSSGAGLVASMAASLAEAEAAVGAALDD
ncbi:unnamed protein product [Discosporangium mesarthrocarpum]